MRERKASKSRNNAITTFHKVVYDEPFANIRMNVSVRSVFGIKTTFANFSI